VGGAAALPDLSVRLTTCRTRRPNLDGAIFHRRAPQAHAPPSDAFRQRNPSFEGRVIRFVDTP